MNLLAFYTIASAMALIILIWLVITKAKRR